MTAGFPIPVPRHMIVRPVGIVPAQPVTSRNSVTGAAPAKASPAKRSTATAMKGRITIKSRQQEGDHHNNDGLRFIYRSIILFPVSSEPESLLQSPPLIFHPAAEPHSEQLQTVLPERYRNRRRSG